MAISGVTNSILIFSIFRIYLVLADLEKIDPDLTRVQLVYGTKNEMIKAYTLDEADKLVKGPEYIHDKTTLFIPDFYEAQTVTGFQPMADAYVKQNKSNYLRINWGVKAVNESDIKIPDVETLVPLIADFIMQLLKHMKRENFHFVAYSIGGKVAYNVSQCITDKTDGKIKLPRLTLLDPTKSMGEMKMGFRSCADFVDAIHTNGAHFGTNISVGHADFWPNGGMIQPGCTPEICSTTNSIGDVNVCSRRRADEFYAESVANQDSGPQFCSYSSTDKLEKKTLMGINCDTNAKGNYYLITNAESPYAMGCGKQ